MVGVGAEVSAPVVSVVVVGYLAWSVMLDFVIVWVVVVWGALAITSAFGVMGSGVDFDLRMVAASPPYDYDCEFLSSVWVSRLFVPHAGV